MAKQLEYFLLTEWYNNKKPEVLNISDSAKDDYSKLKGENGVKGLNPTANSCSCLKQISRLPTISVFGPVLLYPNRCSPLHVGSRVCGGLFLIGYFHQEGIGKLAK